jgi:hypothetical protein
VRSGRAEEQSRGRCPGQGSDTPPASGRGLGEDGTECGEVKGGVAGDRGGGTDIGGGRSSGAGGDNERGGGGGSGGGVDVQGSSSQGAKSKQEDRSSSRGKDFRGRVRAGGGVGMVVGVEVVSGRAVV